MSVVKRLLADGARKAGGELAGGVDFAEEDVGDRGAGLLAAAAFDDFDPIEVGVFHET